MTWGSAQKPSPLVGRVLGLSAILMFVFSILSFNDLLPFPTTPEARKILGPALFFVGFLDMALASMLMRRAR
jgi:hypothetical protein